MQTLETEEYKDYQIEVHLDEDAVNPRKEWDNLGKMVCFHSQYNLGDKDDITKEELLETVKRKDVLSLPLFLLDHSGLAMRTGRFYEDSGGWDTSMVGFIYIEFLAIRKEFSSRLVTKKLRSKALGILEAEVSVYSQYLSGEVYGFIIKNPRGKEIDSCWGFYGYKSQKEMVEDCNATIDRDIENEAVQNAEDHALEVGSLAELVEY